MCYNIAYIEERAARYEERYNSILPPPQSKQGILFPSYYFLSAFEFPVLPLITKNGFEMMQWGLIPGWVKDIEQATSIRMKTLNAVGETAFEKPSFRKAIASSRALLPVAGFYEWRDYNGVKYPYFISGADDFLSLGCICESWTDKGTGEIVNTFSIVTTEANSLLEQIHNLKKRMPLILPPENEMKWLDPSLSKQDVQSLIRPYQGMLNAFPVSRNLNNSRSVRNTPDAINPAEFSELPPLQ
jgi:putative SOS response-associated peptidase YedK